MTAALHYNLFSIAVCIGALSQAVVAGATPRLRLQLRTPMNHPPRLIAAACIIAMLGLTVAARADEIDEVGRLNRSGQNAAAVQRAQKYLAGKPDDAPMRFLLGVMLADGQRSAEAMDVFVKLAADHPELAESHNNLAALYAAAGDYDKARDALEQALRANPNYATAQENLGDVYAALASQAYARAAKLDPTNQGIRPKLALVRELFSPKGSEPAGRSKPNR